MASHEDRTLSAPGDSAPILEIRNVSRSFGATRVLHDVSLTVPRGAVVALLGGSGSGKTTLLQLIAGLQQPDGGTILIEGRDMRGVEAYARPVNMMFQSYALFPHMTVADNIGYGLRARGTARAERERLVEWGLDLVHLGGLGARRPDQLSGGQRQRAALARCLVMGPAILLLDEPMAALDRGLRAEVQRELLDIQRKVGTTFVIVTHDQDEAMALSSRIAVMNQGSVLQVGTPSEIYEFPRSRFVADFIGTTNFLAGAVVRSEPGLITIHAEELGVDVQVDDVSRVTVGQRVWLAVRPEKLWLSKEPPAGPAVNQVPGVVWELGYLGNRSTYQIKTDRGKILTAFLQNDRRTAERAIDWGDRVYASWEYDAAIVLLD